MGGIPLSGQTLVVRDIEAWTSPGNFGAELRARTQPGGQIFLDINYVTALDKNNVQWKGRVVIPYGFFFDFSASGFTWYVTCSGYTLTA
jgi:hypothetical protein